MAHKPNYKTINCQYPEVSIHQMDFIAMVLGMTRTELLRDALRVYIRQFRQDTAPKLREEIDRKLLIEEPEKLEKAKSKC